MFYPVLYAGRMGSDCVEFNSGFDCYRFKCCRVVRSKIDIVKDLAKSILKALLLLVCTLKYNITHKIYYYLLIFGF